MSLLDKFGGLSEGGGNGGAYLRGRPVGDSPDLRRVLALPRRQRPDDAQLKIWAEYIQQELGKGDVHCQCLERYRRPCCKNILPIQAWALYEAAQCNGLLGPIGVGHGKTLLDLLTPMVIDDCKTAALLLPPGLKSQLIDVDWNYYGQHWKLPNLAGGRWLVPGRPTLHIIAYSELSGARATDLLERLRPDAIVVDEAHSVRNRIASRTKRFLRFFRDHPNTRLFAWSGTLVSRSIKDYAHLANLALRDGSPTPHHWPVLEAWAGHLDPGDTKCAPGLLTRFGDVPSRAYPLWVRETPGVVSSGDSTSCQASLIISERPLQVSTEIQKLLSNLEKTWQRPDGEELVDALSKGACARQLSCGFYYRWRWPRKEPREVIERWLEVRKNWHKELREKLKTPAVHMDSPLLCAKAAIRWAHGYVHIERDEDGKEISRREIPPGAKSGPLPTWNSEYWKEWEVVRKTAHPETEAVWIDYALVEDAINWLKEGPGLLWYEFDGLAREIYRRAGGANGPLVFAGPGDEGGSVIQRLQGTESCIASIRAHGTGRNLQQFARNLVANPPGSGAEWEQLLGRTHRQGQLADEVTCEVYRHTAPFAAAVERARDLSEFIEGYSGTQRLATKATWKF